MLKHFMFCSCRTDARAAEASHRAAQKKTGASARDSGECFYNNNKINIIFQYNLLFSFILHLALLCSSSSPLANVKAPRAAQQQRSTCASSSVIVVLPPPLVRYGLLVCSQFRHVCLQFVVGLFCCHIYLIGFNGFVSFRYSPPPSLPILV